MIKSWMGKVNIIKHAGKFIDRISVTHARTKLNSSQTKIPPLLSGNKQLLIDVSVIYQNDSGTGIQRVVRSLLNQFLTNPPCGYTVKTVAATRKKPYRIINWATTDTSKTDSKPIFIQAGDIFLGLDLSAHIIPVHRHQLAQWKAHGVTLHFIVYDILPIYYPEWFSKKLDVAFRKWIKAIAVLADSAICISASVQHDLTKYFKERYNLPDNSIATSILPMGYDITSSTPSMGLPPNFETLLSQIQLNKTILMVGTLEPRKGHKQVLEAFEILWSNGKEFNLIIVGQAGWKTDSLQAKLRNHHQHNRHLFWFNDASDELLLKLYQACNGVIIASLAEGFGLPLIEALSYNKPVLARDILVFREIAGNNVDYFSGITASELSGVLLRWIRDFGFESKSIQLPCLSTWDDSYNKLINIIKKE